MSEATDLSDSMADAPPQRRRRSPIIDAAVVALGGYLLVWMFGDVRYFFQGSEPRDLGDAAELVDAGLDRSDLSEAFVVLRGTPDVQHAARMRFETTSRLSGTSTRTIGYLRIIEGGGGLFAAVPRTEEAAPQQFEGVFEGRMRRLSDSPNFEAIQQHFNGERIVETRDASPAALLEALAGRQGEGLQVVDVTGERVALGAGGSITLVVKQPDVRVQLGRSSFDSKATAEAAVASLGYPYFAPPEQRSARFYDFYVRMPEDQRDAAEAKLSAAAVIPPSAKPADASVGADVLPWTITYLAAPGELGSDGGALTVVPGKSVKTGFLVDQGKLVPRPLEGGKLRLELGDVKAVRLDRPVVVDPSGYVIEVGVHPRDRWLELIMWCLVLVVVGWNIASLVAGWRARRA